MESLCATGGLRSLGRDPDLMLEAKCSTVVRGCKVGFVLLVLLEMNSSEHISNFGAPLKGVQTERDPGQC